MLLSGIRRRYIGTLRALPQSHPIAAFGYPIPDGASLQSPLQERIQIEFPRRDLTPSVIAQRWTPMEQRTGLLALKKGMLTMWDPWGRRMPVTVLHVMDNVVLGHKTRDRDGYDAVVVGYGKKDIQTPDDVQQYRQAIGYCQRIGLGYCVERVAEFKVTANGALPVGTLLNAAHFLPGQWVDVQGRSKDKGFQGVVKRYGFKGQSATHGTSLAHRSPGSIGQRKVLLMIFPSLVSLICMRDRHQAKYGRGKRWLATWEMKM